MKRFILILFPMLLLSIASKAQTSLYNNRANEKMSYTDNEKFSIQVERSAYGYQFDRYEDKLDDSLKKKIIHFMKHTDRKKYKGNGKFTLPIIKRDGHYYIVYQKSPEILLKL